MINIICDALSNCQRLHKFLLDSHQAIKVPTMSVRRRSELRPERPTHFNGSHPDNIDIEEIEPGGREGKSQRGQ